MVVVMPVIGVFHTGRGIGMARRAVVAPLRCWHVQYRGALEKLYGLSVNFA